MLREPRWDIDRDYGKEAEDHVARLMSINKIEVKHDRKTQYTANLFIEVLGNKGEPSGIKVTEASHWAYVIDGGDGIEKSVVLLLPTEKLKEEVARMEAVGWLTHSSPEGASGYLIAVKTFVPLEKKS